VCEAVLAAADQEGLCIPDDLSLIGYGQNVLQLAAPVAITASVPDSVGIGRRAADLLATITEGNTAADEPVAFAGRLIERGSVRRVDSSRAEGGTEAAGRRERH
jgi:DNA-binding LacI/PurR family transcriptional regulator